MGGHFQILMLLRIRDVFPALDMSSFVNVSCVSGANAFDVK